MTLREKAAQMVMPWMPGGLAPGSAELRRIERLVRTERVGGVMGPFDAFLANRGLNLREITPEEYLGFFGNGYATMRSTIEQDPDLVEGFGRDRVKEVVVEHLAILRARREPWEEGPAVVAATEALAAATSSTPRKRWGAPVPLSGTSGARPPVACSAGNGVAAAGC